MFKHLLEAFKTDIKHRPQKRAKSVFKTITKKERSIACKNALFGNNKMIKNTAFTEKTFVTSPTTDTKVDIIFQLWKIMTSLKRKGTISPKKRNPVHSISLYCILTEFSKP